MVKIDFDKVLFKDIQVHLKKFKLQNVPDAGGWP